MSQQMSCTQLGTSVLRPSLCYDLVAPELLVLLDAVQRLAERLAGHEEVGAVHAGQLVQPPDAAQVGVQLLRLLQVPDHLAQHPHQVHLPPDV